MEPLILVAASGLAREVLAAVRAAGTCRAVGILDDDPALHGSLVDGVRVLGPVDDAVHHDARLLVCVGSGAGRARVVERLAGLGIGPHRYARVVDPAVRVPDTCSVGPGCILLSGVVLTTSVVLGSHVVAMPHVVFTHDDVVHDFATFAAGVVLGGSTQIGRAAYLGMNSSVRQGLRVGAASTLGMGAVLLRDLPPGQTWAGVPARPLSGCRETELPRRALEAL